MTAITGTASCGTRTINFDRPSRVRDVIVYLYHLPLGVLLTSVEFERRFKFTVNNFMDNDGTRYWVESVNGSRWTGYRLTPYARRRIDSLIRRNQLTVELTAFRQQEIRKARQIGRRTHV